MVDVLYDLTETSAHLLVRTSLNIAATAPARFIKRILSQSHVIQVEYRSPRLLFVDLLGTHDFPKARLHNFGKVPPKGLQLQVVPTKARQAPEGKHLLLTGLHYRGLWVKLGRVCAYETPSPLL